MAQLSSPRIQVSVRTPAATLHLLDFLPSFNREASPYFYIRLARKLSCFSPAHMPNSPPILSFSSLHWFLVLTEKPGSPEHSHLDSPCKWMERAEHGPSVQRPFHVQRTHFTPATHPSCYTPYCLPSHFCADYFQICICSPDKDVTLFVLLQTDIHLETKQTTQT